MPTNMNASEKAAAKKSDTKVRGSDGRVTIRVRRVVRRRPEGKQEKHTQRPFAIRKSAESLKAKSRQQLLKAMSDEDLMEQFQLGVVEAFDILVSRYKDSLSNYLYRFLGDAKEVEDMLQETFLRVYRNRHSYRRIARFSTWLYTIAGNLARSEYRKRKRRRIYSIQAKNRNEEEYEVEIPDESFSPMRHLNRVSQNEQIQDALKQISPEFREVVVLRDIQQLTYEEIADITGLPMGTVKSRINRGRTRLQKLLAEVYPFELSDSDG